MSEQSSQIGQDDQSMTLQESVACLDSAIESGVIREVKRHGLHVNEFAVLQLFAKQDEWSATQLLDHLDIDPSRMSRLVAKMVDSRLLRRRRGRTDRRVVYLTLTDRGAELAEEISQQMEAHESTLLRGVGSRELAGFRSTTEKIKKNLQKLEESSGQ
ncbi:MarR family winged helix-turn-helix transcriptional regulator [Candidatus Poriferisocius sp.]|uniref:MarR family winged helix-turn-helix transcriptional regulator n=1 Tax=Candidatus Poriferisocius sp. TaxID=3101276 RepID=UPI003B01ECB2